MYLDKKVAVVVPAYNEEKLIRNTIQTIPQFVDKIIVIDDASMDNTPVMLKDLASQDDKVVVIQHDINQGVGGAIISGYKKAIELEMDVTAIMAGDGQMAPDDLVDIIAPIVKGEADYSKGNRLFRGDAWKMIPHYRYLA